MDVEQIPQLLHRLGLDPGAEVTPLGGGITNRNFRVGDLVIRLDGQSADLLGIDRRAEQHAARIAANLGTGADLIYVDADEGVQVTRFVEGMPIDAEQAIVPATMARIVDAIKLTHNGPEFINRFSPFEFVRRSHRLAVGHGVHFSPDAADALRQTAELERALRTTEPERPCHNDLLAANFIDDGERIRIIDWEYAGMGDRWFDLANFATNQELDADASGRLLQLYFGAAPSPAQLERLAMMRRVSDLREAFWGFMQSGISSIDFDFRGYGDRHLARFLQAGA